jgi:hypothetical protein
MKIRHGFVSNSSSSSFVVSGKREDMKCKINIEIDLRQYADEIVTTKEELYNNEYLSEMVMNELLTWKELEDIIDDGNIIIDGRFYDKNNPLESVLCHQGVKYTDFKGKIIFNEEGF